LFSFFVILFCLADYWIAFCVHGTEGMLLH